MRFSACNFLRRASFDKFIISMREQAPISIFTYTFLLEVLAHFIFQSDYRLLRDAGNWLQIWLHLKAALFLCLIIELEWLNIDLLIDCLKFLFYLSTSMVCLLINESLVFGDPSFLACSCFLYLVLLLLSILILLCSKLLLATFILVFTVLLKIRLSLVLKIVKTILLIVILKLWLVINFLWLTIIKKIALCLILNALRVTSLRHPFVEIFMLIKVWDKALRIKIQLRTHRIRIGT